MAPLLLDSTLRAGTSGVPSVSAFAGDDCSAPEEKSTSVGFCGVVKGKLRKEKGGFVEGVGGGGICDPDNTALFGGESRKLAEPGKMARQSVFFFPCLEKSCTHAFDLQSFLRCDCYL